VKGWFTRRRLLASFIGSFVLHAILVVGWLDHDRPAPPPAPAAEIAFVPLPPPKLARTRLAMAGEQPSGRGHALAGSNPRRAGSPLHAPRTRAASGHAEGSGAMGATPAELSPPTGAAPGDPAMPVAETGAAPDLVPIPPAAAEATPKTIDPAPRPAAAPTVAADDAFGGLARAQMMRLAHGDGGGLAGFGDGRGGTGIGLRTELSGRHVEGSHVAAPPVVVRARPVECALPSSLHLNATVHLLVTRDGEPAVPRLSLSSGQEGFDACAVRYVLAMTFSPGVDAAGRPLDVWIDVRVAPVTGGQLGTVP
jgi:hypothetical protein